MFKKTTIFYFSLLILLTLSAFICAFFTSPVLGNHIGKKLFLDLHYNRTAILILENSDKNWESYFLLGRIYFVEGQLQTSTNNFIAAIELNPTHKESYYGRGLSYGFSGEKYLIQAQNDFEKYIELEQKEFEKSGRRAYGAWAGYNDLAWIHFLKGEFELQEKIVRAGLEISSGNAWLRNILGVALLAQNKCEEAKEHLEMAKKILENKTLEEFGEAYSGDHPSFREKGLASMKKVIGENLRLCEKN